MIEDGESGVLVPPANTEALGKAIRLLVENPAVRAQLGRAARERAETYFPIAATQKKIEGVYEELLQR